MGFRKGSYAKVWSVEPKSETLTNIRLSISRKDKNTDEYVQDFSGFVAFIGSDVAKKAANLKEGDRIRLGDVDVSNTYDKEKKVTYYNCKCFNYDTDDETSKSTGANQQTAKQVEDNNEPEPEEGESNLPF